jgi:dihydroflavonol-4-reductase
LEGAVPACPRFSFGVVDVRDVADLHIRAMTNPAAKGERFLAVAGRSISVLEAAKILKKHLGESASKLPTAELPDWLIRILALFVPDMKMIVPELGTTKNVTNDKAKTMLGWSPRPSDECIVATADSLIELGILKK